MQTRPPGGLGAHCRQKGNAVLFSLPPPVPVSNTRFPGGVHEFLNLKTKKKWFFGFIFLGTKCFEQCLCPIKTPSLVISCIFLFTVFVCVCVLVLAARFGCIIYRVMN